jgi:PAS domain S-box-containing protein
MNSKMIARLRYLVGLWVLGGVAIGVVTWVCFSLGSNLSTTVLAYLIVIVLLSLLDSFITSAILSVIAVGCLNYFFVEPIYTFNVDSAQDGFTLGAFVFTALVVTWLVRRVRRLVDVQRERAQLLDLTHDSIFVRDPNGVISYWNRGAELLYGWTSEEAQGKVAQELLQTVFPAPLADITATVTQTGRWDGELVHTKRNGSQVTVSSRWALRRDESGTPIGALETNSDITARKRAETLVRRHQEAYLAEAQKLSVTGSFGWNASTGQIFWSEETFRIFGFEPTLVPTVELVLQRIHPEDVPAARAAIERATETAGFDIKHRLLMPDGSVKYLHVVARLMTEDPETSQFFGAVMDITAATLAEQQLQRAQSELAYVTRIVSLGEMTASIAHEINQPLAAIVTNGEASLYWLHNEVPQIDEATAAVKRIIADGKRAGDIVQRVRALVKKTDQQKIPLKLNDVVADVLPLVRREITEHRVDLRLDLAPGLPPVLGDRVLLQQVVNNLLINGIHAMAAVTDRPRDLVIRSLEGESGDVLLVVRDHGDGIAKEIENRLFDPFFTTKAEGMGMGLAICRSIIQSHEGRVWAQTPDDGPGAAFWLSLPRLQ